MNYGAIGAAVLSAAFVGSFVVGCSSSDSGDKATSNEAAAVTAAPKADDREAKLLVANQGYVDALLKGDLAGTIGYLDPQACDDEDEGSLTFAVSAISKTANGATMKIKTVKLYPGDRGGADTYELSKDASDALRRLVKTSIAESKSGSWVYHDDEWYLAGPCEDDASPAPSSAA